MNTIDFSRINGFSKGQRDSFEELVCQLARREPYPKTSVFYRVDGAGGDGGVEAYWLDDDGKKSGFQAKYHLKAGNIDWEKVDNSVRQTLDTHLTLDRYTIAFPCNLTGPRGAKSRGKSGLESWTEHEAKWQEWAKELDRKIEFTAWTESELIDRLGSPVCSGLRLYWFGVTELTSDWFSRHVQAAIALLDERFHPEDHVEIQLQGLFETMRRRSSVVDALREDLRSVQSATLPVETLRQYQTSTTAPLIDALVSTTAALEGMAAAFEAPIGQAWDVSNWRLRTRAAKAAVNAVRRWVGELAETMPSEKASVHRAHVSEMRREFASYREAIDGLEQRLDSKAFEAEAARVAFVQGEAGTGKSHLFGHEAETSVRRGEPTLLILGQQFAAGDPWSQIAALLDLPGVSGDELLGALSAAADANKTRALLLIDGINEGVGSSYWKSHLAGFLSKIGAFPAVACIVSCRSAYSQHAIPTALRQRTDTFDLLGFASQAEQMRAAQVYMDRRGIARPSTPWLSPEFINPLFLRTTCLAVALDRKSEFPKGLRGTKAILAYYLDAVGRNLQAGSDRTDDLVRPTKKAMVSLAGRMARNRVDFLTRAEAIDLVATEFSTHVPPLGRSWMEVLQLGGLLRFDPPAGEPGDDPLDVPPDVVRFSFQRFQDHLMGQALLESVSDVQSAFEVGGGLDFLLEKASIRWQWSGLLEALSSLVPEQFGVELVDCLPGQFSRWWRWPLSHAFIESAKWRAHDAFTDRTLELLNQLHLAHEDSLALLVELSVSAGHPWNADLLHRNLVDKPIWERDQFWTRELNRRSDDEGTPVGRLIDWCRIGQTAATALENQKLAALTLCWFFTTTNRPIRDKATKALTNLFSFRQELFSDLVAKFANVNDLYVLERLLAAGYAACCIDPRCERVSAYAGVVAERIFGGDGPPLHLLVRDYAFGIVELAKTLGCLPAGLEFDRCAPPYNAAPPSFRISEASVKAIAAKAGGDGILRSAAGVMGDFGQYQVKSQVDDFLTTPLKKPVRLRPRQKLIKFEDEIVMLADDRRRAFHILSEVANPYRAGINRISIGRPAPAPSPKVVAAWKRKVKLAEKAFVSLLTPPEFQRYLDEAYSEVHCIRDGSDFQPEHTNTEKAKLWVVKRAYGYGWTAKRFPDDEFRGNEYSRSRAEVERIGKKYQWLALSELVCRIADNYWKDCRYDALPRPYRYPTEIGFVRDIDPTITSPIIKEGPDGPVANWSMAPAIQQLPVEENVLSEWPFAVNNYADFPNWVQRTDPEGKKWVVLFEHVAKENRYPKDIRREHGLRQQEFRFIYNTFVKTAQLKEIVAILSGRKSLDVHHWEPRGFTDDPYLHEAPWRAVWPDTKWETDSSALPSYLDHAKPLCRYYWEDHLDASLPSGAGAYVPAPWLARELEVRPNVTSPSIWLDRAENTIFQTYHGPESDKAVLLAESALSQLTAQGEVAALWLLIAERSVWPNGNNDNAAWRRLEGVCWLEGGKMKSKSWHKDHVNARGLRGKSTG